MARDAALLDRAARTGESVFSVYSWGRPTLSFGRNQQALGKYDRSKLAANGVDVVRRPTGGRAILHHREITYSVAAPAAPNESLRDSYARVNAVLLEGLRKLGVSASLASSGAAAPSPTAMPCFERPSDGEIIAGGRKLVGSAQWRDAAAFLQHGSILVDDDQSSLAEFAAPDAEDASMRPSPPATLRELLGRAPEPAEVAGAMFDAIRELESAAGEELLEEEVRRETLSRVPEFTDDSWTWRR